MSTGVTEGGRTLTSRSEDQLLPLSALQHLIFCERQCALIHVERLWEDNSLTLEGSHRHKWVDEELPRREVRGDTIILRGLALRSLRLGLVGKADVVEFHRCGREGENANGGRDRSVRLDNQPGFWVPCPVEYKRGKPKPDRCDEVQLCAQALCLEEMMGVTIEEGSLFYGKVKRRQGVILDRELRALTTSAAERLHALVGGGVTPRAKREPKCLNCSLKDICLPDSMKPGRSAGSYLSREIDSILKEEGG